jgi:hypothetical protein
MRSAAVLSSLALVAVATLFACSDGEVSGAPSPDAGSKTPSHQGTNQDPGGDPNQDTSPDAGSDAEAPLAEQVEAEPNNATDTSDLNAMTLPGQMTGAIDPAGDVDGFSLDLTPGDLWEWTLTSKKDLAPHLVVFDTTKNTLNPVRLADGAAGDTIKLAHFVLRPGAFAAIVRDARNVSDPQAKKGGSTFGYTLSAQKKTLASVPVTLPATKSGKLASLSSLDFYTFDGTEGTPVEIILKAARKSVPSTLDSRMSLFNMTSKTTVITNDDADKTTDSEIVGNLPATASYLVVVENEGTDGTDLSYELSFGVTP